MGNKIIRNVIVVTILIVGIFFVFIKKDTYIGFYYPDSNNLAENIQSRELGSLDECRDWVDSQVALNNPSGRGYDYECGKNCEVKEDYGGLNICEETLE